MTDAALGELRQLSLQIKELYEMCRERDRELRLERARTAKLVHLARRVLKFGFNQTENNGVIRVPAIELRDAIADYEVTND